MCLRSGPSPVFIDIGGAQTPFLDDLFGETLADSLRTLGGYPPLHADAYPGFALGCPHRDSGYLISAFSSPLAYCVVLLAFAAGFLFPFRRKVALYLLGSGVVVSLLDTGIRLAEQFGPKGAMIAGLPGQLAANAFFQLALPCLVAFVLVRLALLARRLLPGSSRNLA